MSQERRRNIEPAKRLRTFEEARLGLSRADAVSDAKVFLERERSVKGEGCPLGTDMFGVLRALAKNDLPSAYDTLIASNPLPGITGRLAAEPYPQMQVFNKKSERISLRALETFVADNVKPRKGDSSVKSKQKIAVIGSGPAGLTAAMTLARQGYAVSVFEASHVLGGSLSYAYPEFRIPLKALQLAIASAKDLGVTFTTNTLFGRDVLPADLIEKGYSAIILACGAGLPKVYGIPGEESAGVITVESFLKSFHWMKAGKENYSTPLLVGKKVLVVGSNEKAFDCARILARLKREVSIVVQGSESHMGVDAGMVRETAEETIKFRTFAKPKKVVTDHQGCVKGLVCEHLDYKVDAQGRLNIVVDPDSEFTLEADTIITAAGSDPHTLFLRNLPGFAVGADGSLGMKPGTWQTTVDAIFACGHVVSPGANLMEVMLSAKRATAEIDKYLNS